MKFDNDIFKILRRDKYNDEISITTNDSPYLKKNKINESPYNEDISQVQIQEDKIVKRLFQDNEKNKFEKGHWTLEQDRYLIKMINIYGPKNWSKIAKHINGRVGKQCRERWFNHLSPQINKQKWSNYEDQIIINAHSMLIYKNLDMEIDGQQQLNIYKVEPIIQLKIIGTLLQKEKQRKIKIINNKKIQQVY